MLEKKYIDPVKAKLVWNPINLIEIDLDDAKKIFNIIDSLEENDDIQSVYTNINISEDNLKKFQND